MASHFDTYGSAYLRFSTLFLFALLGCASYSADKECDCHKDQKVELAALGKDLEKKARTPAENDPRKYMAELESDKAVKEIWTDVSLKKLSAVGIISCGDVAGTAVLMCDSKTIVTAAHVVLNPLGQPRWDANSKDKNKDCFFLAEKPNGDKWDYNLVLPSRQKLLQQVGTPYPNTTDQTATDWAVMELEGEGVPKDIATPMKIGQLKSMDHFNGLPLLYSVGFFGDLEQKRAYTVCEGQNPVLQDAPQYSEQQPFINTGCRTYKGGSGGVYSTFQRGNKDPLAVCIASEIRTAEGGSRCVPIQGKFLETIKRIANSKDCIVPIDGPAKQASL